MGTKAVANPNFRGMVANIDHNMGILCKRLDELGLAGNTILIFMTDNGTASGAKFKGLDSDALLGHNAGMRGRKSSVYDRGQRVPILAVWKGKIAPGSINTNLVDFTDVLPTLVELGGGQLPDDSRLDGRSFLGQMLGDANTPSRDWVFSGNSPNAMARADQFSLDAAGQLFDIRENRYAPKLVRKQDFTEIHMRYYKMLSAAMQSLDHPYTGAVKRGKSKKK